MDFGLSRKQKELQEAAAAAVREVVEPAARAAPTDQPLPPERLRDLYRGLAPLGYLGSTVPAEMGGAGLSHVDYGLLLEGLAHGPVLLGEVVLPRLLARIGSREQRERWLPGLLSGDSLSTSAITEPQAGSDIRNLQTSAERRGDLLLLTGRKAWIKLGGCADLLAVLFVTDPTRGALGGTSRVIVERAVSPWEAVDERAVGMRNLSWATLTFRELAVPVANLVDAQGEATAAFTQGIEASRPFVGLEAVGLATHALELATRYVKERSAFGRPLARFQAIQLTLAEAAGEIAAGRWLCLHALWLLDQGRRCPQEASMAKVYATEAAVRACERALECMGAAGLTEAAGAERCWRDARMLTVIDGTSTIQRLIVGRELLQVAAFV